MKQCIFDYYPIQCADIRCTRTGTIQASFPGRINQPNVLYDLTNSVKQSSNPTETVTTLLTHYQASELTITPSPSLSLHIDHDAELIVSHRATTNAPPMHVCFLLKGSSSSAVPTPSAVPSTVPSVPSAIDHLLQIAHIHSPSMLPVALEPTVLCLNDYLPLTSGNVPYTEYSGKDPVTSMPYTLIVVETVIPIASSLKGDGGRPLAHRETWLSPTSMVKSKEGFVTVSSDGKTGYAMGDGDNVMQCDVLPYDADDTEPVLNINYSVDSFSKQYATSMMFYVMLMLVSAISFFLLPMGYMYFYNLSNPPIGSSNSMMRWFFTEYFSTNLQKWGIYNKFDIGSTLAFLISGIVLLAVGFSQTNAALILSGIVLLLSYFMGVAGTKYIYMMQQYAKTVGGTSTNGSTNGSSNISASSGANSNSGSMRVDVGSTNISVGSNP